MSAIEGRMRGGRPYMSIGEVLAVLQADFPDISVSKIRFLESEGLIQPERTASGYRKFYTKDLDRLRFILTLQRDSYLPLKVIRERLAAYDGGIAPAEAMAPAIVPVSDPAPDAQPVRTPVAPAVTPDDDLTERAPSVHLTESDLADQTGLDLGQVRALREFGVICEHRNGGTTYFDGEDLRVSEIARDLLKLGLDARHLKTLRRSAEQEASLIEQLVLPALRNRKPEARRQAAESVVELARLTRRLRGSYLRQALSDALNGDR